MSRYTAFVAADESRVTAGGPARKVKVPVDVPEHVRGIGAGGGMGWGTIGTGHYGVIGHGAGYGVGSGSSGIGYGGGGTGRSAMRGAAEVPQVRIGTATVMGSLDKNIIRRYIRQRLARVRYCYEKALVVDHDLEGDVVAEFLITPDGATSAVQVSGIGDQVLHACVASVIEDLEFPKAPGEGQVRVRYPFHLRPSQPASPSGLSEDDTELEGGTP
jgi:hypothetical protein